MKILMTNLLRLFISLYDIFSLSQNINILMGRHTDKHTYTLTMTRMIHLISSYSKIKIRSWRTKPSLQPHSAPSCMVHLWINKEMLASFLHRISVLAPQSPTQIRVCYVWLLLPSGHRVSWYPIRTKSKVKAAFSETAGCLSLVFQRIFANYALLFFSILQIFLRPYHMADIIENLWDESVNRAEKDLCPQWLCISWRAQTI